MSGFSGGVSGVIVCPRCGASFIVDACDARGDLDAFVLCAACGRGSRLESADRHALVALGKSTAHPMLHEAGWPRVVVGHETPAAARVIADALRRGGFSPICVRSGDAVLAAVDPVMPAPAAAVVVDVAVPGVLAFELIEGVRRNPATTGLPVVLLASVYEKTRYKRRPNRLYGANAYLELHDVPDRIVEVLESAFAHGSGDTSGNLSSLEGGRGGLTASESPVERTTVIARRLLSDMALHHGEDVARGVREGQPFAFVSDAVDAARALHGRVGGNGADFERELAAFASRLVAAGPTSEGPRG
jgi:CheY-like chemotaxis protein